MAVKTNTKAHSIGIIGGSLQSAVGYSHFVACTMDNRWKIEAGCFSSKQEANEITANAYGLPEGRLYNSWKDLLNDEKGRLDAIVVLTPTPAHFEIVNTAMDMGFPVICEKALATNGDEIEELVRQKEKKKSFLAVTYNYSAYPIIRELQKKISEGELGKICHFQIEMPQQGYSITDGDGNRPTPQKWRLSSGKVPLIHLDLAVHLHHLIYFLTGYRPKGIVSQQGTYGFFPDVVDNVYCICNYEEDIQGQMWFSKSAIGHRNGLRVRVYGSKASAEWYQMNPEELVLSHIDGRREIIDRSSSSVSQYTRDFGRFKPGHPEGFLEAFANLYSDLADGLEEYKETGKWELEEYYGSDIALEGLRMLEGMVNSHEKKVWIEL
tara:strand:- start:460 stop:1599 length:1140 start_codon:yes stop_codon:yes gene_type:complete